MEAEAPSWITLLLQVPLVGVFIWYSLETNKRQSESQQRFSDALDKRDSAFEQRNKALIEAINKGNEAICETIQEMHRSLLSHDKAAAEYFAAHPTRTTRSK